MKTLRALRANPNSYLMQRPFKYLLTLVLLAFATGPMLLSASAASGGKNGTLRWRPGKIRIAVSSSLLKQTSNLKSDSDVLGALQRSLLTWERAANISFESASSETQNVSPSGNNGDGVSLITIAQTPENLLLFAKNPDETAATTRVFFDKMGFITEADIVLNPYQQFSTDGNFGSFDLESTLTHEIGHLLGLDHSAVLGSTMFENYGKNGVYGLQNFAPRTLSEIDISSVRARYGAPASNNKCCGAINGKLLANNGKAAANTAVWAENIKTGKVHAETFSNSDGKFEFSGLSSGVYKLFAQMPGTSTKAFSLNHVGDVAVSRGNTAALTKTLGGKPNDFELQYVGFNGQLSGLAVPVNTGKAYTIYLGGKNLDSKNISFRFGSSFLSITPNSIISHDFGADLSVVSFELRVDPKAPIGEYSIFADSAAGGIGAVVGAIAVRGFLNPLSTIDIGDN